MANAIRQWPDPVVTDWESWLLWNSLHRPSKEPRLSECTAKRVMPSFSNPVEKFSLKDLSKKSMSTTVKKTKARVIWLVRRSGAFIFAWSVDWRDDTELSFTLETVSLVCSDNPLGKQTFWERSICNRQIHESNLIVIWWRYCSADLLSPLGKSSMWTSDFRISNAERIHKTVWLEDMEDMDLLCHHSKQQ